MQKKLSDYAFFGGSFDPIHLGHLFLIHQAAVFTPFKNIIISPLSMNNFKPDARPESGQHRINMIKLALHDYKELYPDDEINIILNEKDIIKGGVNYAYDTISYILSDYRIKGKIGYLVGDDILPDLGRWYRIDELKNLVEFYVFKRDDKKPEIEIEGLIYHMIPSDFFKESSSNIREKHDYNGLSGRVKDYVLSNELYRT